MTALSAFKLLMKCERARAGASIPSKDEALRAVFDAIFPEIEKLLTPAEPKQKRPIKETTS